MIVTSALETGITLIAISSVWILVVLAVRKPVARWLGARFAYRLWLLPLVAVLAFVLGSTLDVQGGPKWELPIIGLFIDGTLDALIRVEPLASTGGVTTAASTTAAPASLLGIWALGTILSLATFAFRSWRFARTVARTGETLDGTERAMLEGDMAAAAVLSSGISEWRTSPHGPAVAGLWRPAILLPPDFFDIYTPAQRSMILRHEFHHLRRHDLAWLCVARIFRCLFWFNPLAYLAERCLQLDQEISCDEHVLARSDMAARRLYGETLLTALHVQPRAAHVPYLPTFRQIKERTRMLKHHHYRKSTGFMGTMLVVAALAASAVYGATDRVPQATVELSRTVFETLTGFQAEINTQLAEDASDTEAFAAILRQLEAAAAAFPEGNLSDYELAQFTNLAGYVAFLMKDYRLAIERYRPILDLVDGQPALEGFHDATLKTIAQLYVALEDYKGAAPYVDRAITVADGENPPEDLLRLKRAIDLELGEPVR